MINKEIIKKSIIFISVFLIDCFIIYSAYNISHNYPYNRIVSGGKLYQTLILRNNDGLYNATVNKNNFEFFSGDLYKDVIIKGLIINNSEVTDYSNRTFLIIKNKDFNENFFSFCILLLILGNLHLLWGLYIYFSGSLTETAEIYCQFSIYLGFIFILIDLFILHRANIFLAGILLLVMMLTSVFFKIFYLPVLKKLEDYWKFNLLKRFIKYSIFLITIYLMKHIYQYSVFSISLFIIISLGIMLLFLFLTIIKLMEENYNLQISIMFAVSFSIGFILPSLLLVLSFYYDFPLPLPFTAILTLLIPIVIGSYIINNSYMIPIFNDTKLSSRLFVDYSISIAISIIVYFFYVNNLSGTKSFSAFVICFFIVLILFYSRQYFINNINKKYIKTKNNYYAVLGSIIEFTALEESIDDKMKKMCTLAASLLKTDYIRFNFRNMPLAKTDPNENTGSSFLSDYIINLSHEDNIILSDYFNKKTAFVKKDHIFENEILHKINRDRSVDSQISVLLPVEIGSELIGYAAVGDKFDNSFFNRQDLEFLITMSVIVYYLIDNEVMMKDYLLKSEYEKELDKSSYYQMRLFPKQQLISSKLEISCYTRPFNKLTGDFFDMINRDGKVIIIIGDVTGHGYPAAMIVSCVMALIYTIINENKSIDEIFSAVNEFLVEGYSGNELISLFVSEIDTEEMTIEYINAGHCSPFIVNGLSNKKLKGRNNLLGVDRKLSINKKTVQLERGDEIWFYTDGLIEINEPDNQNDIGDKILFDLFKALYNVSYNEKIAFISNYLSNIDNVLINDDITIVLTKVV